MDWSLTRRSLLMGMAASPGLASARALAGQMDVETFDSRIMREPRRLTIYRPPGWSSGQTWPVIYMADGQFLQPFIQDVDVLISARRLRPLVIVGMWSGEAGPRSRPEEYVEGYEGGARRHRDFGRFFLEEVMPKAEAEHGASTLREARMLAGWSDGGAWALATGLQAPSLVGHVAAFSVSSPNGSGRSGYAKRPALFLASGEDEPYYRGVTRDIAVSARRSKVEVIYKTVPGRHEPAVWRPLFSEAVLWAFGRKEGSDGL